MQKEEYLIKNACYSVTKYYLCKQNNKRSLSGRKQRSQVVRSFPNRYQHSYTKKVTSLFSISCILRIILPCKLRSFVLQYKVTIASYTQYSVKRALAWPVYEHFSMASVETIDILILRIRYLLD